MRTYLILIFSILVTILAKGQLVVDNGDFLTTSEISDLTEQMNQIKEKTSIEILIYTTMDLKGKTIKEYGMNLASQYPVGKKGINNGVVIVLSKNDRQMQILSGFGLEWILSDSLSQSILNSMIPYFKKQEYYNGLISALTSINRKTAKFDWTIETTQIDKITRTDLGRVLIFDYNNSSGLINYKYALDIDPQFSKDFQITLESDKNKYVLYYSKYMNDMIGQILTKSKITIFARMVDWDNKELELLGIE
ncbi:MAG: TPM domain-containing protein [Lentimicrobium sp.]|jgi:hypothetical protein|nr:TPM domain-containing protein [Lentimicrobium sp.]